MRAPDDIRQSIERDPEAVITPELRQKYPRLHFCCEWDLLLIDKGDPEFDCCRCFENPATPGEACGSGLKLS